MLRVPSLQIPSGYYIQTMNSNLHLNDLLLPIGLMNVISILPVLLLAPVIECVKAWLLCMGKTPMAPAKVISEYFFLHTHSLIQNKSNVLIWVFLSPLFLCAYSPSLLLPPSSSTALSLIAPPCMSFPCSPGPCVCHVVSPGGRFG